MNREQLKRDLIRDEGLRLKPYKDSVGVLTIGVGRNMEAKALPADMAARLERDGCISEGDAEVLLEDDIQAVIWDLDRALPWWQDLDDARGDALANMCFNLGITRLLGFRNSLAMLEHREYDKAAANFAMSKWYRQVGRRAERICAVFKSA